MSQVIKHAHEQDYVEALAERCDLIDGQIAELDVAATNLAGKASLRQILLIRINPEHACGAAGLHFNGIEPRVATNVENSVSPQVARNRMREAAPLQRRVITEV